MVRAFAATPWFKSLKKADIKLRVRSAQTIDLGQDDRDRGKAVSCARGRLDLDGCGDRSGGLTVTDRVVATGRLACGLDSQQDIGVEMTCELTEARCLSRLELNLHFADWRLLSVGCDYAATNYTFDPASSERREPSLAREPSSKKAGMRAARRASRS